ncbi:MAG: hypothetical protein K9N46_06875 [Candidatus Marinimicrobia bacterium]|nr:hypothetical protein [Candidatus Neomarinimicrobiota bacterium]MCF7828703.1 hypothetical protein [Candidatus Neomarinimicrobiota bacterium]MCF7880444.1 hypothetical protein [Candidatus Neomarinimicrobiota bacterium]
MNKSHLIPVLLFFLLFTSCSLFRGGKESAAPEATSTADTISQAQNTQMDTVRSPAQTDRTGQPNRRDSDRFYQLEQDVDSLKRSIRTLRRQVRNAGGDISPFTLQREIQKVLSVPQITHEIELVNGTTVRGKVLRETIDEIIVQTQIGHLTLDRKLIKDTRPAEPPKAKIELDGPIEEETHEDKRVYRGRVKNTGVRRADFVRIVFQLSNQSANVVATDSAFIDGSTHTFNTAVLSDTSIEPGESASFTCSVFTPPNATISYYTYEIHWDEER